MNISTDKVFWVPWSSWSTCSVSCGTGIKHRARIQCDTSGVCTGNRTVITSTCVQQKCTGVVIFKLKNNRHFLHKTEDTWWNVWIFSGIVL